jgi:hypothetical protein
MMLSYNAPKTGMTLGCTKTQSRAQLRDFRPIFAWGN